MHHFSQKEGRFVKGPPPTLGGTAKLLHEAKAMFTPKSLSVPAKESFFDKLKAKAGKKKN